MKETKQQEKIKNLINQANEAFDNSDVKSCWNAGDHNIAALLAHIAYSEERRAIAEERIADAFEQIANRI